jgi:hypothetical protein
MADKIFVDGFYSKKVNESAPAYVIADLSVHADTLMKWLAAHKDLVDEKGYMRWTVKDSQGGKRYTEVNTWKPEAKPAEVVEDGFQLPPVQVEDLGEAPKGTVPEF